MPTIKEVLNKVNLSETITESIKYRWLSQLDNINYKYPEDADVELAIKPPYDNVYVLYLKAMNEFFTGDMRAYEKSAREFDIAYSKRRGH